MRRIPKSLEEKILKELLHGATYRETEHKFLVSIATINRVVKDARERIPDFDGLRQLNISLKKLELTPFDVARAIPVFTRLEKQEVGVNELSLYIESMNQMSKEHKIEAAQLTNAMLELVELKTQKRKSYGELIEDFRKKQAEVKYLEERNEILKTEEQRLETQLDRERRVLHQLVGTNERLKKLDLQKIANLSKFAINKETMEKEFHRIKKDLDKKIQHTKTELKNKQRKLQALDTENRELWNKSLSLLDQICRNSKLKEILKNRKAIIPCKICRRETVLLYLPNRMEIQNAMLEGLVWDLFCTFCGQRVQYSPWEILSCIGWLVLP